MTVLFVLSLAFIFYVAIGYPLLLALLPARRRRNEPEPHADRTVSIILPVRNGSKWLRPKLESIIALDYPRHLLQILVVSDGSTDDTDSIAAEYPGIELLRIPPSGKAGALNAGLAHATGELLFFTDVRQQLDPQCLRYLVNRLRDPAVGVASGELIIRRGGCSEEESVGLYWRYEKWIRKNHAAIDSVLGATGCIYMMRRSLAAPIPPDTLNDDMCLPFQAFFQGYRLVFVEEARAYDTPTVLHTEFRRKVRTQAGVYQLIRAFPALLGPGNRMWIHFFSHKLGRLLLPFALVAVLVSSFFLGSPWAEIMVALQTVFYGLALVDPYVSERSPWKRLSSLARTFVVLMAAAACGITVLFRRSGSFWKTPTHGV